MQLRKLTLRVEPGEAVSALYARDLEGEPDALFVRLGGVCLVGCPAVVVDMLSNALRECYGAWASGKQVAMDGSPNGACAPRQDTLPPVADHSEVGDALSRIAPWATAELLVLDGGASNSDPLACGGRDRTSVYLIAAEDVE